jgi:hypothetical protein
MYAPSIQHCRAPFDDQLTRIYTRKVYLEYRQSFNKSTAFRMDENPGSVIGTSWGINGVVGIFVGLTKLLECMLMSRMVNLDVNVGNGSIQVGCVD